MLRDEKVAAILVVVLMGVAAGVFWRFKRERPAELSIAKTEVLIVSRDSTLWAAPAVAPATGAIGYTSVENPAVMVRLPGGETWKAYDGKLGERVLVWSPDGRFLAFRAEKMPEETPRSFALVVADPATKAIEKITDFLPGLGRPAWRIANGKMELYASSASGLVRRIYDGSFPADRHDVFAFEQDGDVWIQDESGVPRRISRGGGYAPVLSPDGSRVLYQWGDNIYLSSVKTEAAEPSIAARGVGAVWSPDGSRIAYVVEQDDGHGSMTADLFVMDLPPSAGGAGKVHRLTSTPSELEMEISWPEKNRIVYSVRNDGSIRSAELAGGGLDRQ